MSLDLAGQCEMLGSVDIEPQQDVGARLAAKRRVQLAGGNGDRRGLDVPSVDHCGHLAIAAQSPGGGTAQARPGSARSTTSIGDNSFERSVMEIVAPRGTGFTVDGHRSMTRRTTGTIIPCRPQSTATSRRYRRGPWPHPSGTSGWSRHAGRRSPGPGPEPGRGPSRRPGLSRVTV